MAKRLKAMSEGLRHAAVCPAPSHAACPSFPRLLQAAAGGGGGGPPPRALPLVPGAPQGGGGGGGGRPAPAAGPAQTVSLCTIFSIAACAYCISISSHF